MTAATSAKIISRVLLRAASNRISLVCSGAAAFGGLAFESSTLGLLALAGYVTSIAVALGRRDLWRGVADDLRRRPIQLPHPCTFAEVAPREFLLRLSNARAERVRAESTLSRVGPWRGAAPDREGVADGRDHLAPAGSAGPDEPPPGL